MRDGRISFFETLVLEMRRKGRTWNSTTRFSGSSVTSTMAGGAVRCSTKIGWRSAAFFGLLRDALVDSLASLSDVLDGDGSGAMMCEVVWREKVELKKSVLTSFWRGEAETGRLLTTADDPVRLWGREC